MPLFSDGLNMRKNPTKRIELYRITDGKLATSRSDGANGAFILPLNSGVNVVVICSDGSDWAASGLEGEPWEHVSVSLQSRTPTWEEMDAVERIFWNDSEAVMQLHVPRSDHINFHEHCLHLWKPRKSPIPTPPLQTVGPLSAIPGR